MTQILSNTQLSGGHGGQGSQEANATRMLEPNVDYAPLALSDPDGTLVKVAKAMAQPADIVGDRPDDQENPYAPAIYTYLGQFVDHDLTFDTVSGLGAGAPHDPNNERTPRFDLDCLYGEGPGSAPYMYDNDGRLATNSLNGYDLPRAAARFDPDDPFSHRAIIGDPRNDENSIVCQLQLAFIHFHNAMIGHFKQQGLTGSALFKQAQREVRFTYQNLLVNDFLKRFVNPTTYSEFRSDYEALGSAAFALYPPGPVRAALPLEFTGAAYRFGHSGVRNGYRLNQGFKSQIFDRNQADSQTLVGFGDLPENHRIDWSLFISNARLPGEKFPNPDFGEDDPDDPKRLQFAYKLDTALVDPLAHLPARIAGGDVNSAFGSLAARNLKRGYNFRLPSGQDIAARLNAAPPMILLGDGLKDIASLNIPPADAQALADSTPLWIYVLAEAQAGLIEIVDGKPQKALDPNRGTQLGPVGGRILMEVFFGVLESDPDSYFQQPGWNPVIKPGANALTLWDVLQFIGAVRAPGV